VVTILTDFPEDRFEVGSRLLLQTRTDCESELVVADCSPYQDGLLVRFEGLDTVEKVQNLKGCYLCVPGSERAELDEGEFYPDQLIGMRVQDSQGKSFGSVREVHEYPAHTVLELGRGIMVPFLREFIHEIDLQGRTIIVKRVVDEN